MSRIHDALKRAEQDREVSGGVRVEVAELTAPGPRPLPAPEAAAPAAGPLLTLEALEAACEPRSWQPEAATMLFLDGDGEHYGREEFRTLRSRLYQLRDLRPLKKVLVASALPEEGRSFVAANLAQAMAQQLGARVLLIDADLRRPHLHEMLGAERSPGLSDYLLGNSDVLSVVQRGQTENLFFIAAGSPAARPAELAAHARWKQLLQGVEHLFDWIVLDSPPVSVVADATLLAGHCDGTLLVARSNATPFDTLRDAGSEFRDHQLLGAVLNGAAGASSAPKGNHAAR